MGEAKAIVHAEKQKYLLVSFHYDRKSHDFQCRGSGNSTV